MRRTKSAAVVVAAVLCSFLLTAGSAWAQDPAAVIDAVDDPGPAWQPANVTVAVGDTVRWEFDEAGTVHDLQSTSDNWNVDSPFKNPGDPPEEYTFTEPGVYTFVCTVHSGMDGSVTVEGDEPADPLSNVLVFSKTAGFRHASIPQGIAALQQLGAENDFDVDATEESSDFTDANLAQYDAVVFLSTTGDVLDEDQEAAFERYVQAGNGYVGIHAAADTEYEWGWYGEMVGGYFRNHPPGTPTASVDIEDATHPSTDGLPDRWTRTDEWYNYQSPVDPVVGGGGTDYSPRDSGVHVLATLDESTLDEQDGNATDDDHPISWCGDFDGGRMWYTGMGHTSESFIDEDGDDDEQFRAHILGGLQSVTGAAAADCGEPRHATPSENDFEIVTIDDDTESPMKLDVADDGRVFYVERITGEINVWDPATGQVTTAAQIPVSSVQENGLIGIALAPDFDTSGHLYVTYTPITPDDQTRLSRFTVEGNAIDPASEQVILTWQAQREECCHSSGAMAFGLDGSLYIATGDNTNPFASDGFAPIDERPGREYWDAQRTSANTNDLNGKLLRIVPIAGATGTPGEGLTYTIPEGNLFDEADDAEDQTRPEIYAMGFRNPFTITVDPKTGWVLLGDYGPDAGASDADRGPQGSVEFNVVDQPGNYGWPYCVRDNVPYHDYDFETGESGPEFDCDSPVNESPNNTGLTNLPPALPATMWMGYSETDPRVPGLGTGGAPTSGPRYDFDPDLESDTKFPQYFDGHWFIGEWNSGWIKTATLDADGDAAAVFESPWMDTFFRPHQIEFGPDGSLYVIDWGSGFGGNNANSGIYRIDYVKGNRRPIAQGTADPDSGPLPLEVQFSSEGSTDPDGTSLTYHWDFGDGMTSTDPDPVHTFEEAGTYDVLLTVTDESGSTGTDTVQVVAGNTRPTVEITIPEDGQFAAFGEAVPYEIAVSDPEDGDIDCEDVTLNVQLGHDDHAHGLYEQQGCEGTFETATAGGHGGNANIFTSIVATYTDQGGSSGAASLTGRDEVILHPKRKRAEHFDSTGRAPGGAAGGTPGVQTEGTSDAGGGNNIGFIEHGDYVSFERVSLKDLLGMRFRVASAGQGGTIQLRLDAPDGDLVAETEFIDPTGGWQSWVSVDLALDEPPEGTHELFLVFNNPDAGDNSLMNLNWFEARGKGAAVSAAPDVTASAEPDRGDAPLEVQFTGEATDPDAEAGEELSYEWDFGVPGTTEDSSDEQNPTYVYERAGTYSATLTVTDPHGASGTATAEVRVTTPAGECPPTNVRSDEFEGDALDTNRWTVIRPDDTRPPTVSGGELHFPIDNGSIYGEGTSARNIVVQPLPDGDVSVTAKLTVDELSENYHQAGLRVYSDDDNWASVHMIHAGGARDIEFIYENEGNPRNGAADKLGGLDEDAPLTYWVRINSDGSELTAEYSFDGETFEPVGQPADISGWSDPRIGPVALSDQAPTYPVAHFDWVRFDPDATGGGGGGDGIVDEFDGSDLGSAWDVVRRDQQLTVSGGTLNIPAQTGDIYGGRNDARNLVIREAPGGAWEATAKLNFVGTAQYHQAGIMVYGDDQNFTKFGRIAHTAAGDEKFEFIYENAGTPRNEAQDSTGNLPGSFPDDFYVRMTSDGTNVTGAYSTDGSAWTPVGRPAPLPADAQIGLFAFSNDGAGDPVAAFDSFTLTGDEVGGGGGSSFSDGFDGSSLDKSRWNAIVRENADAYEVADGQLTITTESGDIYTGNNTDPLPNNFILQSADHAGEDWVIETKLSGTIDGGFAQGGLMTYVDDDNYVKYDAISDEGNTRINRIELRSEVGGSIQNPQQNASVSAEQAAGDIWLRLTKSGTDYSGEYSFDGETWTGFPGGAVPNTMEAPDFGIYAFGVNKPGGTVSFDHFLLDGQQPGDPCVCPAGPGDEFDGSSLDKGKWNGIVREDESLYEVSDGALRVTTVGGDIYGGSNSPDVRNFILQDAPAGDWVIETKVSGDISGGYEQGGLLVYEDDDNYIKYDLISDDGQTVKNRIELRSEVGGTVQSPQPQVGSLDVDAAWLRLTKEGTTYTGEYSLDGESWTELAEPVTNGMAAPKFGLFTLGVNSPGGTVVFDYFSVDGSTGCPPQEPDNTAPVIESATATPSSGFAPLDVDFAVEASDADEDELTYSWDFGDGGTSTEQNPSHTYEEPGEQDAEVTVSDGTAERSRTVPVNVLADDDEGARFRILVFSKTAGFRHSSIDEGHAAIAQLGEDNDFQVDHSEDATLFRDDVLERYDAVVWLSTTGDVLDDAQEAAFERYIEAGGGYTGIHAAADTEYDWKWYGELVGAYFLSHPQNQTATVDVEDSDDPSTRHLDARWERFDEWYNYKPVDFEETGNVDYSPRDTVHVLASLDESTYDEQDGNATDDDHPISWCKRYEGGRSWYTGMGHTEDSFTQDEDFLGHILGGIEVAAGVAESEACGADMDVPGAPTVQGFADPTMGSAPLRVRFSATGLDPDGGRITYRWDFGDGARSFARNPRHTYTEPGEYTAVVTATDREGKTGTDAVEITVGDGEAPTVQATADVTEGDAPLRVRFRSTGDDPDGRNGRLVYEWDFGDGGRAFGRNAVHRYMEPGTYTATVTVTDRTDKTGSDSIEITVTNPPGNVAPNVEAAADPQSGSAPLRVRLTSQGTDPDGDRLTYEWDLGDGSPAVGRRNVTHTYTQLGTYTATVTVTDTGGLTASEQVEIEVVNGAPTVRAAADPSSGTAPLRVRFSSAGRDPDGDPLSYVWDFGDGVRAGGRNAVHTYAQPGTYNATVTVTDRHGATGSATVQVTVGAPGQQQGLGGPPQGVGGRGDGVDEGDVAGESAVSVRLAKSRKVRRVVRRGLRYRVACETDCRVAAKLRLNRRLAARLGLERGARALGRAKARSIEAGDSRRVVVKLSRKLRRQLGRAMRQAGIRRLRTVVVTKVRTDAGKERLKHRFVLRR